MCSLMYRKCKVLADNAAAWSINSWQVSAMRVPDIIVPAVPSVGLELPAQRRR